MTNPRDSAEITQKLKEGEVKPDARTSNKSAAVNKKKDAPKAAEKKKAGKEVEFPIQAFVNLYGFLKIKDRVLEKIGWPKDEKFDVTLDWRDGALVIRKR